MLALLDVVLLASCCVPESNEGALKRDDSVFFDQIEVTAIVAETDLTRVKYEK